MAKSKNAAPEVLEQRNEENESSRDELENMELNTDELKEDDTNVDAEQKVAPVQPSESAENISIKETLSEQTDEKDLPWDEEDTIEENTDIVSSLENPEEYREEQNLIAVTYILYHAKQYKPGDKLPAQDSKMVSAWIQAGTAKWKSQSDSKSSRARLTTAQPGLPGKAIPSFEDDLIGRPPTF